MYKVQTFLNLIKKKLMLIIFYYININIKYTYLIDYIIINENVIEYYIYFS